MTSKPVVSIGVPTYNRAAKLEVAVEYMLAQDYRDVEIVISDNASSDHTPDVCERLRKRDSRVTVVRQSENIGPIANYMAVLETAHGPLYMQLADDDWLAPDYVRKCTDALLASPDHVLVCGKSVMHRNGQYSHDATKTNLLQYSASDRVVTYYKTVVENGSFHGVIRREVMLGLPRMINTMGGDWMYMASVAFQGKVKTLESTHIIKHLGGATASWEQTAATLRLPQWQAKYWPESILSSVFQNISWRSPAYENLGLAGRQLLASRVAVALIRRFRMAGRWYGKAREFVQKRV